jgi:endoglucanase
MKRYLVFLLVLAGTLSLSAQDYASLHNTLIRFYGYQRAGLKTGSANNCNEGWANATHNGDDYNGNQLDGGWYDAGDYIKFGMPLSYTVYCLLKGYDLFPGGYSDNYKADNKSGSDGIPDVLNQVKFATDYIMKAVINETTVILDVGLASEEHGPMVIANNPGGRKAGQCVLCSGADIPATYAACLALMSTLYKKHDEAYSKLCLDKAIVAFKFAKKKVDQGGDNNFYSKPQYKGQDALYDYYTVDGDKKQQINDRLAAAGVELYRATNDADPVYREWAKKPIVANYNCMSYSFIGPLASIETWRQGLTPGASTDIGFIEGKVQTSGFFTGVFKNSGWGTARDAGTAAFVYALAYITTPAEATRTKYLQKIKDHVGFVTGNFGSTKRSYVIGYNNSPATNIHYRTTSAGPAGGVISGPGDDGSWTNDGTPEHCEVALDYNAGIVGAVGFLKAVTATSEDVIKVSSAFSATPAVDVDFSAGSVKFAATLSKAVPWTITVAGGSGSRKFTGTTAAVSATWDGTADEGLFLSGETVSAKLAVEGEIVVFDILKAKAISLSVATAPKPPKAETDVLVDDFDDGDLNNKVSGIWIPFGTDSSFANKTTTLFTTLNSTKAIQANCTVLQGGEETYAGVKTTFSADGVSASIGSTAKAVVFDMKSNKEAIVYVELEQASITNGAYYSMPVPVTKSLNTYRLDISKFKQSSWKTAEQPLELSSVKSVRFTVYDSTGLIQLTLDNVYIDGFSPSAIVSRERNVFSPFVPVICQNTLRFTMPFTASQPLECMVFAVNGKAVLRKNINAAPGAMVALPLSHLSSGVYTISHSVGGAPVGERILFTMMK